MRLANNDPFPAIPTFSIYISPFTSTTIVCGKFSISKLSDHHFLAIFTLMLLRNNSMPKSQANN